MSAWGKAGNSFTTIKALPKDRVEFLPPDSTAALLKEDPDIVVLDIRDRDLFSAMRLPYDNVLHIEMAYLEDQLDQIPRGKKLFVACHAGKQGMQAAPFLKSRGFNVVGCLDGGIMAWQKAGYSIDQ